MKLTFKKIIVKNTKLTKVVKNIASNFYLLYNNNERGMIYKYIDRKKKSKLK